VPPTLHPWNTSFSWRDHTEPPSTLSPEQVRQFDEQGFVVVPDLLTADVLDKVVVETDRFEAEIAELLRSVENQRVMIAEAGAITFAPHLVARSPVLRALTHDARLVGICRDLIGRDVRLYWDQVVYKLPEKPRRFPWHQDNGYAYVEPQQYLTIWIALTDATLDNGCPHVAPGIHRSGTLAHHYVDPLGFECMTDPAEAIPAPVAAGGAVVLSSLTPHLTGPNRTTGVRKAYIVQYAPDGAERLEGDPAKGPPAARTRCDDPRRQYFVLRGGEPAG
jgi:phytanoyl-CoA hydroxylase